MTFVWRVDYGADDTFERVAAIRRPWEANRNLNCVVATEVSVHSPDFAMPADPCQCLSTRDQVITVNNKAIE